MKIRINKTIEVLFTPRIQNEAVDLSAHAVSVEIRLPNNKKIPIESTVQENKVAFSYQLSNVGTHVISVYLDRGTQNECACDVKALTCVKHSYQEDVDDDEITIIQMDGNFMTLTGVDMRKYATHDELIELDASVGELEDGLDTLNGRVDKLHNYDDTEVLERLNSLEGIDHSVYAKKTALDDYAKTSMLGLYQLKGNYALKTDIPDISGKADKTDVANTVRELRAKLEEKLEPAALYPYALKDQLQYYQTKGDYATNTALLQYATKDMLNFYQPKGNYQPAGDYVTHIHLKAYALKEHTHNDYINRDMLVNLALKSEIPDTSGYLTQEDLPTYDFSNFALKSEIPNISNLATKDEIPTIPDVPTKLSDLLNDTGFITSGEVTLPDMGQYALKTDIPSLDDYAQKSELPSKTSDLLNDSGYLTEHQDLSGYATKSFVTDLVGDINTILRNI